MLRLALAGGGITIAIRKLSGHILKAVSLYRCLMTSSTISGLLSVFPTASQYCTKLRALIDYVKEWRQQLV